MIRQTIRGFVTIAAVVLLIEAAVGQQPVTRDKITIPDRDKKDGSTKTYDGRLELRPTGLVFVTSEKSDKDTEKLINLKYSDILKYRPGDLAGVNRDDMNPLLALEDAKSRKDSEAAKAGYAALLRKAASAPAATKRHLEYRAALMSTRIANEADDEKWTELAGAALKEWSGFLIEYKNGWELWPAAKASARLDTELGKYDESAKMWSRLAKNPELPPELRVEAGIQEIDSLFRAKAYSAASASAEALLKTAGPGPAKDRLAIYTRAAKAAEGGTNAESLRPAIEDITKFMAASADPTVRGVGYGVIGELHLAAGQPREAMWAFLTVETVHNADKDEVLKAMVRLVQAFKAQADQDDNEKRYREKIRRFRAAL